MILQGDCLQVLSTMDEKIIQTWYNSSCHSHVRSAFCFSTNSRLSVRASHDCDKHEKRQVGGFLIGETMAKRDLLGRFIKGIRAHPETEFKKGEHWREPQSFREKDWLYNEYVVKERSAGDIASQFGITDTAIFFWLRRHNIQRRAMTDIRSKKHWGLSGALNGMFGKTGDKNPHWKGGATPERQAFYASLEWKRAKKIVWNRDRGECQRCHVKGFHYHHIVSFAVKALRADPNNLVLLCDDCHKWVHSKKNINKEFIVKEVI